MGIINVTPDSFAVHCTSCSEAAVLSTASQMLQEGADILDIGGYSTRPGAAEVPEEEEWRRVKTGLSALRNTWPDVLVSVDTWRSGIARRAIEEYGADIINDVSGGLWDSGMEDVIAHARVPYILMHTGWTNPQQTTTCPYPDGVVSAVLGWLQERIDRMHQRGVTDVIADPGFGFGKTTEENWTLLRQMDVLQVLEVPILAGLSRKSMFYKTFGGGPEEALNATTAAHMVALERGADILRVHDVKAAKEAVTVYCNTRSSR
jgi:dihydropteroate synthase